MGKCIHDTLTARGVHLFVHSLAQRGQRKRGGGGQVPPLNQPKLATQSGLWLSFPPDICCFRAAKRFVRGVGVRYLCKKQTMTKGCRTILSTHLTSGHRVELAHCQNAFRCQTWTNLQRGYSKLNLSIIKPGEVKLIETIPGQHGGLGLGVRVVGRLASAFKPLTPLSCLAAEV